MQIKFTISSNSKFADTTYPVIVDSLLHAGVPQQDIYFFIGGYDKYSKKDSKVNTYNVPHNSIDFTGLISVIELELESDYWFLLHDTCVVGREFYSKVRSFFHNTDTVALSPNVSMNIGAYSQKYLHKIKPDLLKFKNEDYSEEALHRFKIKCVEAEDVFFKTSQTTTYGNAGCTTEAPLDFYKNGTLRVVEYYSNLDLYKVKANWFGKDKYELNL